MLPEWLFWLSIVPFVTGWVGENRFAQSTLALYGVVLLMAALAYTLLQNALVALGGENALLAAAVGSDRRGRLSLLLYLLAIPLAFVSSWIAGTLSVAVAVIWLVPDPRIEQLVAQPDQINGIAERENGPPAVESVDRGTAAAQADG